MKVMLTIQDFCEMYSISRTSAYREIGSGKLIARKLRPADESAKKSKTLIHADDARAWADALPIARMGELAEDDAA